jgi:hypothetical protein
MKIMKIMMALVTLLVLGCGDEKSNCNEVAQLDEVEVCIVENSHLLSNGWTGLQLNKWCETGVVKETWYDKLIRDRCTQCPTCCVRI